MKRRITLDIDQPLLDQVDHAAQAARLSRNQFIAASLREQVRSLERDRIDREFEEMGRDPERRRLLLDLERELSPLSEELDRRMSAEEAREGVSYDAAG